MKKRILECPIHGLTLFRCKRKCWKGTPGKPYSTDYTEKCFKCINEGRYEKVEKLKGKRNIFIKI
ncbi:hypothetical protein HYX17_04760 [Candidatus Woesearchaeota archaeon]|nr:hypothetical protein [Candidatus Woesearchaeota archaeon]